MKDTAGTLRRIAGEASDQFTAAEAAVSDAEQREDRNDRREAQDLAGKFPALDQR
jgi:hypothetical protein